MLRIMLIMNFTIICPLKYHRILLLYLFKRKKKAEKELH